MKIKAGRKLVYAAVDASPTYSCAKCNIHVLYHNILVGNRGQSVDRVGDGVRYYELYFTQYAEVHVYADTDTKNEYEILFIIEHWTCAQNDVLQLTIGLTELC